MDINDIKPPPAGEEPGAGESEGACLDRAAGPHMDASSDADAGQKAYARANLAVPANGAAGTDGVKTRVPEPPGRGIGDERFAPEQRWTARIAYEHHGLATGQIARLIGTARDTVEAWRVDEDWQVQMPAETETATRTVTAELARETIAAIRRDLAALGREAKEASTADIEKRARAHLALTKSVRDLEAMVKDLEQTDDAGRYPSDVVEFRSELERRIAAIAEEGAAPRPD